MGLAASQSRFLAITARKASCEYQSMDYAQQKLSISRKLTNATAEYQNALGATKLLWDASGSETAVTDLSYDVMMTPSALNGYDPYMITNTSGQIILNDKYKKAATYQQNPLDPNSKVQFNGTLADRNLFIDGLANSGIISGSMAEIVKGNDYISNAGYGAEPLDKTASNAMTLGNFTTYLQNSKVNDKNPYNIDISGLLGSEQNTDRSATSGYTFSKNSVITSISDLNIADLLSDNVILTLNSTSGKDTSLDAAAVTVENILKSIATSLGMGATSYSGLYTDEISGRALDDAYVATMDNFNVKSAVGAGDTKNKSSKYNNSSNKAKDINAIAYSAGKNGTKCSISLSNLASTFLTAYAQSLEGYQCGYSIRENVKDSVMVTEDPSYYYVVNNDGSIASEKDLLITDFYNIMYNNLCANGWTTMEGADIDDKEYLAHALKNGQLFVSSMNTDGYYYQDAYTKNGYVQEVTDDDAIAEAEAAYNTIKSTLNYKEERIELQMQNLDLEISALSTEFDTVKNMISKSVEKTFTMFSS